MPLTRFWPRAKASGIHLAASALVAALAAVLVFVCWYPGAFRALAGGQDLFLLVVAVDIVAGPALTFVAASKGKTRRHLLIDLALICMLQLAALGYGLTTVYEARPVALVFEVDRFRVLTANAVLRHELPQALPQYRELPLTGPWQLATRASTAEERLAAIDKALQGFDIGQRPGFWIPYADAAEKVREKARPLAPLLGKYPAQRAPAERMVGEVGLAVEGTTFMPVMARGDWVALLTPDAKIIGFLPIDGFVDTR